MNNDVIFLNQSEPVFSWSLVKVWVSWSDPQMCWQNACNLICGSNCRSDLIWNSWTAVWSPLVKCALTTLILLVSVGFVQFHRFLPPYTLCSLSKCYNTLGFPSEYANMNLNMNLMVTGWFVQRMIRAQDDSRNCCFLAHDSHNACGWFAQWMIRAQDDSRNCCFLAHDSHNGWFAHKMIRTNCNLL